jgi:putative oxidoreductase
MRYLVLIGRIFYTLIFVLSAFPHFSKTTIDYAGQNGVPIAGFLVPLSGVLLLVGGLSVLLGYKARWGAWLLIVFLVTVTLKMHNFWTVGDPISARIEQIMFMKNLSMLGAALLIAYFGSGPLSLENRGKN